MSRNDKAPFRREYTVEENGFAGSEDGVYVGDILSLHMEVLDGSSTTYLMEGSVGSSREWQIIRQGFSEQRHYKDIDISSYEYIRIYLQDVVKTTKVIIFGYDSPVSNDVIESKMCSRDYDMLSKLTYATCSLLDEIKNMNIKIDVIIGEELDE